jgi:hypothetical protein
MSQFFQTGQSTVAAILKFFSGGATNKFLTSLAIVLPSSDKVKTVHLEVFISDEDIEV